MDIFLTYQGRKYIIETKINRSNIDKTIDRAVEQLCRKYLLTARAEEGYLVTLDVKTKVGELSIFGSEVTPRHVDRFAMRLVRRAGNNEDLIAAAGTIPGSLEPETSQH